MKSLKTTDLKFRMIKSSIKALASV